VLPTNLTSPGGPIRVIRLISGRVPPTRNPFGNCHRVPASLAFSLLLRLQSRSRALIATPSLCRQSFGRTEIGHLAASPLFASSGICGSLRCSIGGRNFCALVSATNQHPLPTEQPTEYVRTHRTKATYRLTETNSRYGFASTGRSPSPHLSAKQVTRSERVPNPVL